MTPSGRPRRAETDAAINAATRELLTEVGYGDLAIEGVARRAGVGKPTVYRRHDSKASLVAAALLETLETVNPTSPCTDDVNADAKNLLTNLATALTSTDFGTAVTEIISPAARESQLAELFRVAVDQRRVLIRTVFHRAAEQQRLMAGDVELAIDMALGAVYFRHLITHESIGPGFVGDLVDTLIAPSSQISGRR